MGLSVLLIHFVIDSSYLLCLIDWYVRGGRRNLGRGYISQPSGLVLMIDGTNRWPVIRRRPRPAPSPPSPIFNSKTNVCGQYFTSFHWVRSTQPLFDDAVAKRCYGGWRVQFQLGKYLHELQITVLDLFEEKPFEFHECETLVYSRNF